MRIEYHRSLIADTVRNAAFFEALKLAIRPGQSVVADVGAGTGLLGLMAAKLGAREVFLYESAEVARVAEAIIAANKFRNCHVFPCHSTEMTDPPQADIVVSETLGNYAPEENIIDTMKDARRRFLMRGGILLPSRVAQFVAPVVTRRIHRELTAWDDVGYGLDLSPAKVMSLNNIYVRTFSCRELLNNDGTGQQWDSIDFRKNPRNSRSGRVSWGFRQSETIYGFAAWWQAELTKGIALSTGPGAPKTHWEQLYLPLLNPVAVAKGQRLTLTLRSKTSPEHGTSLIWHAVHYAENGEPVERQALDLDRGWLP